MCNKVGLSGLISHIKKTILLNKDDLDDEVIAQITAKYPLSKSSLKYLFTLYEELEDYILEIEKENNRLKDDLRRFESKKLVLLSKDTQNNLEPLKNSLKEKEDYILEVEKENNNLQHQLELYEDFFSNFSLCSWFYNNFAKRLSNV